MMDFSRVPVEAQRLYRRFWAPKLGQRIYNRVRDLPWQASKLADGLRSTEFSKLAEQISDYTMVGNARLRGLYQAVNLVERRRIAGDVVECGAARGGSAALMGLVLARRSSPRKLWVFDNFEGMPEPTEQDPDYEIAKRFVGTCRGDYEDVHGLFARLGLLERTHLIKGLFQDTLAKTSTGLISVLHIDGDWYDSVRTCLQELYPRVAPGGVIQIDDYGHWEGARKAVHELEQEHGLKWKLRYLDYAGRQFIKPA
ncbi:MAG: TylF/MycF/NovP-related O-methyltransferase [Myxococcaceae bacterium]